MENSLKELNKPISLGCYVRFMYLGAEQVGKVLDIYDTTVKVKTMLIDGKEIKIKLNISSIIAVK